MSDPIITIHHGRGAWQGPQSEAPTSPQEAEPVAWLADEDKNDPSATTYDADVAERWLNKGWKVTPLYVHPAPAPAVPVEVGLRSHLIALMDEMKGRNLTASKAYADAGRALRAQPAPQVKALNWGEPEANGYIKGRMGDREYMVNLAADGESWSVATRVYAFAVNLTWSHIGTGFKSLVEAKAAAQADFERRILSALSGEAQR